MLERPEEQPRWTAGRRVAWRKDCMTNRARGHSRWATETAVIRWPANVTVVALATPDKTHVLEPMNRAATSTTTAKTYHNTNVPRQRGLPPVSLFPFVDKPTNCHPLPTEVTRRIVVSPIILILNPNGNNEVDAVDGNQAVLWMSNVFLSSLSLSTVRLDVSVMRYVKRERPSRGCRCLTT